MLRFGFVVVVCYGHDHYGFVVTCVSLILVSLEVCFLGLILITLLGWFCLLFGFMLLGLLLCGAFVLVGVDCVGGHVCYSVYCLLRVLCVTWYCGFWFTLVDRLGLLTCVWNL